MNACFYLFSLTLTLLSLEATGRVYILKPYHPFYVYAGDNVTITCKSGQHRSLQWLRQTPRTGWNEVMVNASTDSGVIIRTLNEYPSGNVETMLIKSNIQLTERGMYTCRDMDAINSYSAWIIVLQIFKENVTHAYNEASPDNDSVMLYCNVSGFDSNAPMMRKEWFFKGQEVITENSEKYTLTDSGRTSGLLIMKPGHTDIGTYKCSFTLGTDHQPVTFTETLSLNVTGLPQETSGFKRLSTDWIHLALLLIGSLFALRTPT